MLRTLLIILAAAVLVACKSGSSPQPSPTPQTPSPTPSPTPTRTPEPTPVDPGVLRLVGKHDLGGRGGADVWASGNTAYVGGICGPARILDVSNPADPQLISRVAEYPETSAQDVMVIDASSPSFTGKLLAAGLQGCSAEDGSQAEAGLRGLDLWDVTDPNAPARLGFFDVGAAPIDGVHELYLFQRGNRAFALLAVPHSEVFHPDGFGDFRIVEVTDPRNPRQLGDWGAGKDGGLAFGALSYERTLEGLTGDYSPRSACVPPPPAEPLCRGDFAWVIAHSVSASKDGTRAFLSYWDAGMVILDIKDPANPVLIGRGAEPPQDEGNVHSAIEVPGRDLAVTADEDFILPEGEHVTPPAAAQDPSAAADIWGFVRIWDISEPAKPRQVGRYQRPDSASTHPDGIHTVHNPEVHESLLYLSWYTDGLRVLDITKPASPREVASFVPPPVVLPSGREVPPYVWGVHVEGDLVFLSDMAGGLYILQWEPA